MPLLKLPGFRAHLSPVLPERLPEEIKPGATALHICLAFPTWSFQQDRCPKSEVVLMRRKSANPDFTLTLLTCDKVASDLLRFVLRRCYKGPPPRLLELFFISRGGRYPTCRLPYSVSPCLSKLTALTCVYFSWL